MSGREQAGGPHWGKKGPEGHLTTETMARRAQPRPHAPHAVTATLCQHWLLLTPRASMS